MSAREKYNVFTAGLLPGLILPVISFFLYYLVFSKYTLESFMEMLKYTGKFASLISLSALPNLLLFFIFIWLNMIKAARGVIGATLFIAFAMLIVKFAL